MSGFQSAQSNDRTDTAFTKHSKVDVKVHIGRTQLSVLKGNSI